MRGISDRFEQYVVKRKQLFRRGYLTVKLVIGFEERETLTTRLLDFVEVFQRTRLRSYLFRERPLERIVPKARRDAAERLFDHSRRTQDEFST